MPVVNPITEDILPKIELVFNKRQAREMLKFNERLDIDAEVPLKSTDAFSFIQKLAYVISKMEDGLMGSLFEHLKVYPVQNNNHNFDEFPNGLLPTYFGNTLFDHAKATIAGMKRILETEIHKMLFFTDEEFQSFVFESLLHLVFGELFLKSA